MNRLICLMAQSLLGVSPLMKSRARCYIRITSSDPTALLSNKQGSFFSFSDVEKMAKVTWPRPCNCEVAEPGFKFTSVSEVGRTHG